MAVIDSIWMFQIDICFLTGLTVHFPAPYLQSGQNPWTLPEENLATLNYGTNGTNYSNLWHLQIATMFRAVDYRIDMCDQRVCDCHICVLFLDELLKKIAHNFYFFVYKVQSLSSLLVNASRNEGITKQPPQ